MTRALSETQRTRPIRSCLRCRVKKQRCLEGVVEGNDTEDTVARIPCLRCKKVGEECLYAGLRRTGRPVRLEKGTLPKARVLSFKTNTTTSSISSSTSSNQDLKVTKVSDPNVGSTSSRKNITHLLEEDGDILPNYLNFLTSNLYSIPIEPLPLRPEVFTSTQIYSLANQYLNEIHPFLPLFNCPLDAFSVATYLQSQTSLLSFALQSLLNPSIEFNPPSEVFTLTISDFQAALLIVYASYGRGDAMLARTTTAWLADRILLLNWNLIDSPSSTVMEEDRIFIRRIWWETWSVDILLGVVSGLREFKLQEVAFEVNTCEAGNATSSLKLRALSLLVQCTAPPSSSTLTYSLSERIEALTSLASTIYILSYTSYHSKEVDLSTNPYFLAASKEAAFMAIMISSASTIFLLSSSEFSSYLAPIFTCGLDTISDPPPIEVHDTLRMASNQIFDLLKTSSLPTTTSSLVDQHSTTSTSTNGTFATSTSRIFDSQRVPHSPFFGCAILVGSQGALLTLGTTEKEKGNHQQVENFNQESVLQVSTTWRSIQVRSQLDLAEWSLEEQAKKWKGIEIIRRELQSLRSIKFMTRSSCSTGREIEDG